MLVKVMKDCDSTNGLTLNKEYTVTRCIIHSWSTDVYVINDNNKEEKYNSTIFDKNFQKEFHKAMDYFDKNDCQVGACYGVFLKDYY